MYISRCMIFLYILYDTSINPALKCQRAIVKNRIKFLILMAKGSVKTSTFH
jgi:hypothetical protein